MKINCTEYREKMELLALKYKMEKQNLDSKERKEIEERIKELESSLDLD